VNDSASFHYNPDWLSDQALLESFVARQNDFFFLRDELARAPLVGSVQHYLLVGLRGAGKTTLLKRLAVAIRSDADLHDHLIALSFPEELYEVKHLADFWWAACAALADELDRARQIARADRLMTAVEHTRRLDADPLADAGLRLLLETCAALERRPVLLIDNLDLVFERIDKKGRKLKDPHAPAYWALREALSTATSPIVIGGSVRLSEPFTDYDKAFYDFFLPKRLGKLSLDEVRRVLEHLADAQEVPAVKARLSSRPGRIEALYDLTGGNPRAVGLIFELLRQGPASRAVEDFQRLLDTTTPYYKARFEDLPEQAQVVMHALAVRRPGNSDHLRFGHTAAEIGLHTGLPTGTISAQMDVLDREGLVEKSAAQGRTQYRIAEQLFRLWLQMRSNRRIRQNVIGLTEFLEAMYDSSELLTGCAGKPGKSALAAAQLSFAVAATRCTDPVRRSLEAQGADRLLQHFREQGGRIDDALPAGDLPEDLEAIIRMHEELQEGPDNGLSTQEIDALLGSLELILKQKQGVVAALHSQATAADEAIRLRGLLAEERQRLLRDGLRESDLPLLFRQRSRGLFPLPVLTPDDVEAACQREEDEDRELLRSMAWRLLGSPQRIRLMNDRAAEEWLNWGLRQAGQATSTEWANVAATFRRSAFLSAAAKALEQAFSLGTSAGAWNEQGVLLVTTNASLAEAENAYRKAIELDPADARPWFNLGHLLSDQPNRLDEAETAYRKAIELDPADARPWFNLGHLLSDRPNRLDEAETAYRKAIEIDQADARSWSNLGVLLSNQPDRLDEAETAYHKAIEIDQASARSWFNLGILLSNQPDRLNEAETAYGKAIELDKADAGPWNNLGALLSDQPHRLDEAETAYRKAMEIDPADARPWLNLGNLLSGRPNRLDEAETAYRKAIEIDPANALPWNNLGNLLSGQPSRPDEAETAYRKAIELDPAYALPWNNLGILLSDQPHRLKEVETAYRKAMENDPADADPWNNLGILLSKQPHRLDEAETAYRKAIELDPADALPWNNLGNLLSGQPNRLDEAETAYRKAIEIDPANALPWLNLGALLSNQPHRLNEAETAYRKALELNPEDARAWNGLGLVLEAQDRLDEAGHAYGQARKRTAEVHPYVEWKRTELQTKRTELQTRRYTTTARQALEAGDAAAVRDVLGRLLDESTAIAAAVVSEAFVEDLLVPALASGHGTAAALLTLLRDLGFEKHARPLLLALEAVIGNCPEKLADIEPEIQSAARLMFERLTVTRDRRA
jgi:tetratricopeptide (TPR) repeat protein